MTETEMQTGSPGAAAIPTDAVEPAETVEPAGTAAPAAEPAVGPAAAAEPVPPEKSLLRNLDFQALWTSEALAALAKESAEIAYPLLILATTGSALYAGIVGSAQLITASFLSIPGGTLADRIDRRLLLMACNLVRVLLLGLLGLLIFTHSAHLVEILLIAIGSAACLGIAQPAGLAAIKALVPPSQLTQATGQNQIRFFGATVVGPPVGGSLFGIARGFPYLAAAVSFLLSTVLLLFIRKPMQLASAPAGTGAKEKRGTIEGFRFLFRQPILAPLIIWIMGSNMAFTHSGIFLALIATAKHRGAPASFIGITLAVAGLGGLSGSLIAGWIVRKLRPTTIVLYAAWVGPVAAIALAVVPGVVPLGIIVAFVFIRGPIVSTLFLSYLAAVAPDKVQGRVLGAVMFMSMIAAPAGVFIVGWVFDLAGSTWVFITVCAIATVAALPTLTRQVLHLPKPEEVAV